MREVHLLLVHVVPLDVDQVPPNLPLKHSCVDRFGPQLYPSGTIEILARRP